MKTVTDEIELALNLFNKRYKIEDKLKNLGVVRSNRFVADFGEWLACKLYNGTLSKDKNEKGWDFKANGIKYQVKTHHKAEKNKSAYSLIKDLDFPVLIFELIPNYRVKSIYYITTHELSKLNKEGHLVEKRNRFNLKWRYCKNITDKFRENFPSIFSS